MTIFSVGLECVLSSGGGGHGAGAYHHRDHPVATTFSTSQWGARVGDASTNRKPYRFRPIGVPVRSLFTPQLFLTCEL